MTLVMLAAAGGQDDLLRLLIRKGAKVNGRQKNGTTALIHAAEKVGHHRQPFRGSREFLLVGRHRIRLCNELLGVTQYLS